MKLQLTLTALTLAALASAPAFAAADKVCFSTGTAKGDSLQLHVTKASATVSKATANAGVDDGTYKADGSVNGRDGVTYLSYYVSSEEGGTDLLVDESLLESGTKGYAKVRWRGESFEETKFFCRDDN
jgi:hypothetical protein